MLTRRLDTLVQPRQEERLLLRDEVTLPRELVIAHPDRPHERDVPDSDLLDQLPQRGVGDRLASLDATARCDPAFPALGREESLEEQVIGGIEDDDARGGTGYWANRRLSSPA